MKRLVTVVTILLALILALAGSPWRKAHQSPRFHSVRCPIF